jgi:hypothetical protein
LAVSLRLCNNDSVFFGTPFAIALGCIGVSYSRTVLMLDDYKILINAESRNRFIK